MNAQTRPITIRWNGKGRSSQKIAFWKCFEKRAKKSCILRLIYIYTCHTDLGSNRSITRNTVKKRVPSTMREDLCFDYFLRVIILVMACLMTTPAFSVSFFDRPVVTQTLTADWGCQPSSRGVPPNGGGILFSRVIKTPLARHCLVRSVKQYSV